jgi:hypothetical protein
MKPCECKDAVDVSKLDHSGLQFNDRSIQVIPNYIEIVMDHTTIKIPMSLFKKFATWYLADQ